MTAEVEASIRKQAAKRSLANLRNVCKDRKVPNAMRLSRKECTDAIVRTQDAYANAVIDNLVEALKSLHSLKQAIREYEMGARQKAKQRLKRLAKSA